MRLTQAVLPVMAVCVALGCAIIWDEFNARSLATLTLLKPIAFKRFAPGRFALVTLLTSDPAGLSVGACKIARQAQRMTNVDLVMLTLEHHPTMAACGWRQVVVKPIDNTDPDDQSGYAAGKAYTKLHIWNLTQYERLLYVDLDTLPVAQFAGVFEQRLIGCQGVAMVVDAGRGDDYFNTGVMLVVPNKDLFKWLVGNVTLIPHDPVAAEQNYLNAYFKGRICTLPKKYNAIVADRVHFPPHVAIIHYTNIKVHHKFSAWWGGLNDLVAIWDFA
jgi:hypothetical protein